MDDLAQLISWRAKLLDLRMGGVREVTDPGGDRVRFGSDAELARAIASVEGAIRNASRVTPHTITFRTSKGL
ncbi:hypothetical protein VQH23_12920 [Pararoseomonas sp. SCSIO 73927]|uniref:phage head-tail joining protein n=1 Tax=Pararoseomonas sp. SCSIO 73927 TaxID=3114537 RepID=UPI0030D29F7A